MFLDGSDMARLPARALSGAAGAKREPKGRPASVPASRLQW
jgi:hypothetical protein